MLCCYKEKKWRKLIYKHCIEKMLEIITNIIYGVMCMKYNLLALYEMAGFITHIECTLELQNEHKAEISFSSTLLCH